MKDEDDYEPTEAELAEARRDMTPEELAYIDSVRAEMMLKRAERKPDQPLH